MTMVLPEHILNRFRRLIGVNRLAHAYFFSGPAGQQKLQTALALAQMVNCDSVDNLPCGQCGSCLKIQKFQHPDIYIIGNHEEDSIKIDEIRIMLSRVALRAFEAKMKVFIIKDAHRMTKDAANSLLKTLEEPAAHTLMILTTSLPQACLDTIKSRCHQVLFFSDQDVLPVDKEQWVDAFLVRVQNDDLIKELTAEQELGIQAMQSWLAFVRDALLYKNGVGEPMYFQTRLAHIQQLSARSMDEILSLEQQIIKAKRLMDEHLNAKMALGLVRQRIWGLL